MSNVVFSSGGFISVSFEPLYSFVFFFFKQKTAYEMLNLEAQFRHSQKLESIGQLAAGVAHDFNNILTVIQGYSDCLLARCNGDKVTFSALKQISNASQRAAGLTRQLLMFSRKQLIQPKILDLNAVLQNLTNMLPRLLGEDVHLEAHYKSS